MNRRDSVTSILAFGTTFRSVVANAKEHGEVRRVGIVNNWLRMVSGVTIVEFESEQAQRAWSVLSKNTGSKSAMSFPSK